MIYLIFVSYLLLAKNLRGIFFLSVSQSKHF